MPTLFGSDHQNWKGEKAGYSAIHKWLVRNFGKAQKCEKCESTNMVEWANKSGSYRRDLSDWLHLCRKCHASQNKEIKKKKTVWLSDRKQLYFKHELARLS